MRGRGPHFQLPPPAAPEPNPALVVAAMLRQHAVHLELKELKMKVAELSTKIDTLISVAMTNKQTIDGAAAQAANMPEDDPEVAALGQRIDEAIAVLQGTPRGGPSPVSDPNAPVV